MHPPLMTVPLLKQRLAGTAASTTGFKFVAGMDAVNRSRWVGSGGDPIAPADVSDQSLVFTAKAIGAGLGVSNPTNSAFLETLAFGPTRGFQLAAFSASFGGIVLTPSGDIVGAQTIAGSAPIGILEPFVLHFVYSQLRCELYLNGEIANTYYPTAFTGNYSKGADLSVSSAFFPLLFGFAGASLLLGTALTRAQIAQDFIDTTPSTLHMAGATHEFDVLSMATPTSSIVDGAGSYDLTYASSGSGDAPVFGFTPGGDYTRLLLFDILKPSNTRVDHQSIASFDCDYWWVLAVNEGVPSVAQMKAGEDSTGASGAGAGTQSLTAGAAGSAQIASGLTADTQHWLYGYAESGSRIVGPKLIANVTTGVGALGAFDNSFGDQWHKA